MSVAEDGQNQKVTLKEENLKWTIDALGWGKFRSSSTYETITPCLWRVEINLPDSVTNRLRENKNLTFDVKTYDYDEQMWCHYLLTADL